MYQEPLRIIHIVYNSSPSLKTANGVAFVLYGTIQEQRKQNIDISVLELGDNKQVDKDSLLSNFITNICWYKIKRIKEYLLSVKKEKMLCLFHSVHGFPFIIIGYLLRYLKISYVVVCHGGLSPLELKQKKIKKILFKYLFQQQWLNKASGIHALTLDEKKEIENYGVINKIFCIPNGVNPKLLEVKIEENYLGKYFPASRDKIKFLFLGRLDIYHKGLDLLLEGYSMLSIKEKCRSVLFIVGPSVRDSRQRLTAIAIKLGIIQNVIFLEGLYRAEKYSAISNADLFCHPSRYEGFPMSVLEVLFLGIPVLATKSTSVEGKIGEYNAGIVLNNESADEISKSMSKYLGLSSMAKIKMRENTKHVVAGYLIEEIVKKQKLKYEELLE